MVRILTILVFVVLIVNGLTFLMVADYIKTQEVKAAAAQPASPPPKAVDTTAKQPAIQPVNPELLRRLTTIEASINSLTRKVDQIASRPVAPIESPIAAPAAPRSSARGAITGDRRRPASAQPVSSVQPVDGDVPVEAEGSTEETPEPAPSGAGTGAGSSGAPPGQPAPEAPQPVPVEGEAPPPADPGSGAGTPPGESGAGGGA